MKNIIEIVTKKTFMYLSVVVAIFMIALLTGKVTLTESIFSITFLQAWFVCGIVFIGLRFKTEAKTCEE